MRVLGLRVVVWSMALLCLSGCGKKSTAVLTDLTVNGKSAPIGIDSAPYFSWKMQDVTQGQMQNAYQITVSDTIKNLQRKNYIWDSGKVETGYSVSIPYGGSALESEKEYVWQVKVWDKDNLEAVSEPSAFEMGLLQQDWDGAKWICCENHMQGKDTVTDTAYDISYVVKMDNTVTGFVWGASRGKYGEHTRWEIDATGECPVFRLVKMNGEYEAESAEYVWENVSAQDFLNQEHRVKLSIKEDRFTASVDDIPVVCDVVMEKNGLAGIGLWVSRGETKAWYDDILITGAAGEVLYEEHFEGDRNIFSPYYMKVENGYGRADSGYVLAPGWEEPSPLFRCSFDIDEGKEIEKARLYATAMGIYDAYVNGVDVCEEYAAPGQSVYTEEVYYRVYDVTSSLQKGKNAMGFVLGHGRFNRAKESWGEVNAICVRLAVEYTDGTRQIIVSDENWLGYDNGPVRNDDLYSGEYYDANYEVENWADISCDESLWKQVGIVSAYDTIEKVYAPDMGVKVIDTLSAVSISELENKAYVLDFGQNFNGVASLCLQGKKGDTITIRYAEYLNTENLVNPDDVAGAIYTRNLFTADNTDYYTFKEDEEVWYTPTLVYRGFRYVQIEGLGQQPTGEQVKGLVIATDNPKTGEFACSDEALNNIYQAIYWTQLSNFVDIPTDCPQRDERLGWSGDAQCFTDTAVLNADIHNFMNRYIRALRVGQLEDGAYPEMAPHSMVTGGANGWSDAGIILVWKMYQQYGNVDIIHENMDAMCAYAGFLLNTSTDYLREYKAYADHNAYSMLDGTNCNTMQCAYVMDLLSKMCEIIGEYELAGEYRMHYEGYRDAWREKYLGAEGEIGEWKQTEYVLPLAWGLYTEELEEKGAEKLILSVRQGGHVPTTGYVSSEHLLKVLCEYGYVEDAYQVFQNPNYPSWNYLLSMGATTMTERWNGIYQREDGMMEINGSLNHYGLGAVGNWFYTGILGINRDENEAAYKHFILKPYAGGGLTYAEGSYESMYGTIKSSWRVEEGKTVYSFTIPANTSATVYIPDSQYDGVEVVAGTYTYEVVNAVN